MDLTTVGPSICQTGNLLSDVLYLDCKNWIKFYKNSMKGPRTIHYTLDIKAIDGTLTLS